MRSDLEATARYLDGAKTPEDVFGKLAGTSAEKLKTLTAAYRKTAKVIHPDRFFGTTEETYAKDLFGKLTEWKEAAEAKVHAGTYGDNKPFVPPPPPASASPQVIKTAKRTYVVTDLVATGDLADIYNCAFSEGGKDHKAVFKVAQSPGDNDLMENEARVLGPLFPPAQENTAFYRYLPKLLDSFMLKGGRGTARRVNVLTPCPNYVTLAEVMKEYPKGLDFRDMVWMFKRVLAGIGYVHLHGVVHGALTPAHILVHPTHHGAKFVDWCYAVKGDGRVKALSKPYKAYYAPEILAKQQPTPATDIFMAAKCAVALIGGDVTTNKTPDKVPREIRAFLNGCLIPAQHRRPDSAWRLHEEFDELLMRLVGPPKYRPLLMPAR